MLADERRARHFGPREELDDLISPRHGSLFQRPPEEEGDHRVGKVFFPEEKPVEDREGHLASQLADRQGKLASNHGTPVRSGKLLQAGIEGRRGRSFFPEEAYRPGAQVLIWIAEELVEKLFPGLKPAAGVERPERFEGEAVVR